MGLDIVELIMRVEEEFEIEIPDSDAEMLSSPGMLCAYIEHRLGRASSPSTARSYCPTSRAFYAVRRELMQLGIERRHITPQTSLEALWSRSQRRHNWNALGEALHFDLPSLCRSPEWAFVGLLPIGLFPIWLLLSPATAIATFVFYIASWWLGSYLTQPLAVHTPKEMRSVADLARRLSPRFCIPASQEERAPDLWPIVRGLIADEFSIPVEQVARDAHFISDLGLG